MGERRHDCLGEGSLTPSASFRAGRVGEGRFCLESDCVSYGRKLDI